MNRAKERDTLVPSRASASRVEALAQLAELPAEEKKILRGMALWVNHYSIQKAAKTVGVPWTTLRDRINRERSELEAIQRDRLEIVQEHAAAIEEEAYRATLEGLQSGKINGQAALVAWGVSVDKHVVIEKLRHREEPDRLSKLLERLGSDMDSVELKVTRRDHAIDVAPPE